MGTLQDSCLFHPALLLLRIYSTGRHEVEEVLDCNIAFVPFSFFPNTFMMLIGRTIGIYSTKGSIKSRLLQNQAESKFQ